MVIGESQQGLGGPLGPALSPDRTKIAVSIVLGPKQHGTRDVWVMQIEGTGLRNLTNSPAADTAPAWSPDGMRIVFQRMDAAPLPDMDHECRWQQAEAGDRRA